MTAQMGEKLIFKGEEISMAAEPLSQYLKNRNDIKFVSPSTACWRGYYGQWEIKENRLYLIALKAYVKENGEVDSNQLFPASKKVGLNYLFPGQKQVFASWFNGKIRIPQGEMLDYVHMGYGSLFEKDLFLVFENGILVKQYEVDNAEEYQKRLKQREQDKEKRRLKDIKQKKEDRVWTISAIIITTIVYTGAGIGIFNLIRLGTMLAYLISATIAIPLVSILGGVILFRFNEEKRINEDKIVAFIAINLLVVAFIGIGIGVFYLIKWGTILAYVIASITVSGMLYLTFITIKNQIKKKKYKRIPSIDYFQPNW